MYSAIKIVFASGCPFFSTVNLCETHCTHTCMTIVITIIMQRRAHSKLTDRHVQIKYRVVSGAPTALFFIFIFSTTVDTDVLTS